MNEDEGFTPIYVMSRIQGLSTAIKDLSSEISHGISVIEINIPSGSNDIDPSSFEIKNAEIVIGDPLLLASNYQNMQKLIWAHCTWAGIEPLFKIIKEQPRFIVTRHCHEDFSEQMAEYVMAQILNLEKNYKGIWAAHAEKSWSKMKHCSDIAQNRPLKELTLGILGVGNMGSAIARFFKLHGTRVIGLSRMPRKSSEFGSFDNIDVSLNTVLSSSDYIINTLPSTAETIGLLNGDVLQVCNKMPVFINVGRGDIIDENTIFKALGNKWLSHVVLDVLKEEPLPADSMLWNSSQVTITPHCAAISLPKYIAKDFIASYVLFQQKRNLKNVVDWKKGY